MQTLEQYIKKNFKNYSTFARSQNVTRQQVHQWIQSDKMIVINDALYLKRRDFIKN